MTAYAMQPHNFAYHEARAYPAGPQVASGLDDPSPSRAFFSRGQESLPSALAALAQLMEAEQIVLLHRAAETGQVRPIGRASGDVPPIAVDLPDDDDAVFVAPRQSQWTTRRNSDEAVLLVKLMDRRSGTIWAAICYGCERAQVSPRVTESLPTFVTLLVSHAATMVSLADARNKVQAVVAALDQQEGAIFIVKRDHGLLFANRMAQEIIGAKAGLQLTRSKLRPLAYQDAVRFETAIDCIIDAPPRHDGSGRPGMVLQLPVPGYKRSMIVTVVPAGLGTSSAESRQAAAIISVLMPDRSEDKGVEVIGQMYGLSPVETKLVRHLVAGASVADAATEMRVKVDTARAYLKQVFAKTGTNKQSSLIQLVTRYQRAIRGDFAYSMA